MTVAFWFTFTMINLASLSVSVQYGSWITACPAAVLMVVCLINMGRAIERNDNGR